MSEHGLRIISRTRTWATSPPGITITDTQPATVDLTGQYGRPELNYDIPHDPVHRANYTQVMSTPFPSLNAEGPGLVASYEIQGGPIERDWSHRSGLGAGEGESCNPSVVCGAAWGAERLNRAATGTCVY